MSSFPKSTPAARAPDAHAAELNAESSAESNLQALPLEGMVLPPAGSLQRSPPQMMPSPHAMPDGDDDDDDATDEPPAIGTTVNTRPRGGLQPLEDPRSPTEQYRAYRQAIHTARSAAMRQVRPEVVGSRDMRHPASMAQGTVAKTACRRSGMLGFRRR